MNRSLQMLIVNEETSSRNVRWVWIFQFCKEGLMKTRICNGQDLSRKHISRFPDSSSFPGYLSIFGSNRYVPFHWSSSSLNVKHHLNLILSLNLLGSWLIHFLLALKRAFQQFHPYGLMPFQKTIPLTVFLDFYNTTTKHQKNQNFKSAVEKLKRPKGGGEVGMNCQESFLHYFGRCEASWRLDGTLWHLPAPHGQPG